ncbi:MAG: HypC/HybG/HupF family hydrogenase formation chaperone [Verrucomicrobia bacterium]|nr:HypC/HybG/HupF family hydrogenase formation chaperone [Verrucomicrobiota bacterium]
MCLAIPGSIESITSEDGVFRKGKVNFAGIVKEVSLAYVPDANVGDYVIVHAGFAISILDQDEARSVFELLDQMAEQSDVERQSA